MSEFGIGNGLIILSSVKSTLFNPLCGIELSVIWPNIKSTLQHPSNPIKSTLQGHFGLFNRHFGPELIDTSAI